MHENKNKHKKKFSPSSVVEPGITQRNGLMYPAESVYGCYLTVKICLIAVLSDSFQKRKQILDAYFNYTVSLQRCSLGRDQTDQREMSDFHIFTRHPLWVVTNTGCLILKSNSNASFFAKFCLIFNRLLKKLFLSALLVIL